MADESGAPVVYLRTMEDSRRIKAALTAGTRIGIVGGGWIGLEVASAARNADAEVTLVESLEQPLLRVLGPEVATIFAELHREHGVDLRLGASLTGISRDGDRGVLEVADSDPVACDLVVVGIGIEPVTELATAAGLTVDNGIRTDERLRTSSRDVYAAGDVANADHPVLGRPVRVEHWDTAIQHGKVVARNILGEEATADALPYFFTDQYDLGMEYVGSPGPDGYDRVVLRGDTDGPGVHGLVAARRSGRRRDARQRLGRDLRRTPHRRRHGRRATGWPTRTCRSASSARGSSPVANSRRRVSAVRPTLGHGRTDRVPAAGAAGGRRAEPLWREAVGQELREERHRQERTLADVAEESGVSTQYLSEIERGRKEPSSEILGAVSGALGLRLVDLTARITRTLAAAPRGPLALARLVAREDRPQVVQGQRSR